MDATQVLLAGAAHADGRSDFAWAREQPHGSAIIRLLGYAFRKALRHATSRVTFDRASFERAVAAASPGALFLLAPSHRSYFDFLLMSYLCFQHPELEIPVPHIAAAEEFSHIPLVGRVLRKAQAFYIRRGVGKQVPELNQELLHLTKQGGALMFFIEGQRSRARHVLPPKRGLLRGLQATGRSFAVLPIAFGYERLPEESAFVDELHGMPKPRMSLRAVLGWLHRVMRGEVELGRIHIACGAPAHLHPAAEIKTLSHFIVAEQQRHTAVSRFHLRAFLLHAGLKQMKEEWLACAIRRRGGRVLDGDLPPLRAAPPPLQQSLRNQWMHWFFEDALKLFPNNLAVRDHIERHSFVELPAATDTTDVRLRQVVTALLSPVVLDYELAVRHLGPPGGKLPFASPRALLRAYPVAHLPHLEDAYRALAAQQILREESADSFTWGPEANRCGDFYSQITADFSIMFRSRRRRASTAQRTRAM